MAIYFLRHGQSEANVAGLFAGQKENSPLTPLGIEQAEAAGNELLSTGIDRIICTSLRRADQTAKIVGDIIGVDQIETDDRLLEYDMGVLTGTSNRDGITSTELVSAEGAEDTTKFQGRVLSALKDYMMDDNRNILLVSHAGVGRMIESTRQQREPASFYDIPPYPNARAVKLNLDWLT